MARELKGCGARIGAHTDSHPLLSRLPRARQFEEIVRSLDRVDTELGERPRWLAYPVGTKDAFDATTIDVARRAGVEMAFSNYGGRVTRADFTPLDVRRVPVESMRTFDLFSATVTLPQVLARPSRAPRTSAASRGSRAGLGAANAMPGPANPYHLTLTAINGPGGRCRYHR